MSQITDKEKTKKEDIKKKDSEVKVASKSNEKEVSKVDILNSKIKDQEKKISELEAKQATKDKEKEVDILIAAYVENQKRIEQLEDNTYSNSETKTAEDKAADEWLPDELKKKGGKDE